MWYIAKGLSFKNKCSFTSDIEIFSEFGGMSSQEIAYNSYLSQISKEIQKTFGPLHDFQDKKRLAESFNAQKAI